MNKEFINKIINKYKTKYNNTDWYKYYREKLKQYINDYYSINDLITNVVCSNLIPINCNVKTFAINVEHNTIYMALWNNVINVSKEINKYLDC